MNINDNYVGTFFYTILLGYNVIIIQFQPTFHVSFSVLVYYYSIYIVYNQISGVNIDDNYFIIFPIFKHFNSWCFVL